MKLFTGILSTGERVLALTVTNAGTRAIDTIAVELLRQAEVPVTTPTGLCIASVSRLSFVTPVYADNGPLDVGEARTFYLPAEHTSDVLSFTEALSPDAYYAVVLADGETRRTIRGKHVYKWVQRAWCR